MISYLRKALTIIVIAAAWTSVFPQTAQEEVQKRIDIINQLIEEKGYRWKAGITSLSYLSMEELKSLCGEYYNQNEFESDLAWQDSMYKEYKSRKESGLLKTLSPPDWKSMMSPIEDQECSNCWAHATTGVVEGLLHYQHGSNVGIDLYEMDITNNNACGGSCSGGSASCGFSYVRDSSVVHEPGLNAFPNYDHAHSTILSYDEDAPTSILNTQSALNSSPIYASMWVYEDFFYYTDGIYEHTWGSLLSSHGVVILGYNDEDEYWVCKNSWGTGWGESGYFKIAYGECGIDSRRCVTASVNASCPAKLITGLMSFSNAMGYSFADEEWAYIHNNTTLSSNVTVPSSTTIQFVSSARLYTYGDLIVNNNATLNDANIMVYSSGSMTVNPGVTFNIADWIYSYGELQVQGNYSNKVRFQEYDGVWKGLTLIGPSTGLSYINYAVVSGSEDGIRAIGTPFFHMTAVTAENNHDHGLRVYSTEYSDDTWFTRCKFINNYGHGAEIDDAYAYFGWSNDFEWNGENGINMKNYGVVTFGEEEEEAEAEIKYNDVFGIRMYNNCAALIGRYSDEFGGYNEIYGNDDYDVYLSGSSDLYAELTWWGSNPPVLDNFLIADGCIFDYEPYETSPPLGKRIPSSTLQADTPARFLMYIWELARQDSTEGYVQTQEVVRTARNHPDPRIARLATRLHMRTLINNGKVSEGIAIGEQLLGEDNLDDEDRAIVAKQLFYAYLLELKDTKQAEDMFHLLAQLGDEDANNGLLAGDFEHATGEAPSASAAPPKTAASSTTDDFTMETYPNPFNPSTTLRFNLPEAVQVRIVIYNMLGQEVATLVDGYREMGRQQVVWQGKTASGRDVPSGIYIARLVTPATTRSVKLVLLR